MDVRCGLCGAAEGMIHRVDCPALDTVRTRGNKHRTAMQPDEINYINGTRTFETGACRDADEAKIDYEAALSPLTFEAMCTYMHHCRKMPGGSLRSPDNWQKGMPLDSYIKSAFRHIVDWWKAHRHMASREGIVFALCGIMFNVQGYLHEYLKMHPGALEEAIKNNPRKGWENEPKT